MAQAFITINIKDLKSRKTFPVQVAPDDDADALKAAIEKAHSTPANAQRLVFGGKTLRAGVPLRVRYTNTRAASSSR